MLLPGDVLYARSAEYCAVFRKLEKWLEKKSGRSKKGTSMPPAEMKAIQETVRMSVYIMLYAMDMHPDDFDKDIDEFVHKFGSGTIIQLYEQQFRLAKTDGKRFMTCLHDFYKKTAKLIVNGGLYAEFSSLCDIAFNTLPVNRTSVIFAVFLSRQIHYLNGFDYNFRVCGRTRTGEIMLAPIPRLGLETTLFELDCWEAKNSTSLTDDKGSKGLNSFDQKRLEMFTKLCRKNGVPTTSMTKFNYLCDMTYGYELQLNFLFPFIDEYTYDILPRITPIGDLRCIQKHDIFFDKFNWETIIESLKHKRARTIPSNGVTIHFLCSDDDFLIQEVLMKEVEHDEEIVMLFRLKTAAGDWSGAYQTASGCISGICAESENSDNIISLITYLYACVVLRNGEELKRNIGRTVQFVKARSKNGEILSTYDVKVEFSLHEGPPKDVYHLAQDSTCDNQTARIRNEKMVAVSRSVNAHVRTLPKGWHASERAKELAKRLGIELSSNETLVHSHYKTVFCLQETVQAKKGWIEADQTRMIAG